VINRAARRRDKDDEIFYPLLHFLVNGTHQSIDRGINHRGEEPDYNWFRSHVLSSSFGLVLHFISVNLP
jgi:hypothetical protein